MRPLENDERFPLFVVAGMPLGAMAFLNDNLRKHPQVFMPQRAEVNYFSIYHQNGIDWYHALYRELWPGQVAGDISPLCFFDVQSLGRMCDYNPEVRVVLVVRDPVDWAVSLYSRLPATEISVPSFTEFLTGYEYNIGSSTVRVQFDDNYLLRRVNLFRNYFSNNLLLIDYEHFRRHHLGAMKAIEQFLDLDPYYTSARLENRNVRPAGRKRIKWLSNFMKRKWLFSHDERQLQRARLNEMDGFDLCGVDASEHQPECERDGRLIKVAEQVLGQQQAYLRRVFANRPIQLGTGATFPASKAAIIGDGERTGRKSSVGYNVQFVFPPSSKNDSESL